MLVREYQGDVIFLRQVVDGTSDRSYGIHVARLAGFPKEILLRAGLILSTFEDRRKPFESGFPPSNTNTEQLGLFRCDSPAFLRELQEADIDRMTPVEALNYLYSLKQKWLPKDES